MRRTLVERPSTILASSSRTTAISTRAETWLTVNTMAAIAAEPDHMGISNIALWPTHAECTPAAIDAEGRVHDYVKENCDGFLASQWLWPRYHSSHFHAERFSGCLWPKLLLCRLLRSPLGRR